MRISDWGSDVCYSDLSADILRRTGASTIGADRPGLVCARLFTRFDAGLVLPEIAEVVFVHHALPHSQRQVGKCQFHKNFTVLDKEVTLTRPLRAEKAPMHHESMEMIIFLTNSDMDYTVQTKIRKIAEKKPE